MSSEMQRVIQEITEEIFLSNKDEEFQRRGKHFIKECFSNDAAEFDWIRLCDMAKKHEAYKFAFLFMCSAVHRGLSFGEYTCYLRENLDMFMEMIDLKQIKYPKMLCGANISKLVLSKTLFSGFRYSYYIIDTNNRFIIDILKKSLNTNNRNRMKVHKKTLFHFAKSFGSKEMEIHSLKDVNCQLIFEQAEYYKNSLKHNSRELNLSISFLCFFYRWLVNEYPEFDFFQSSYKITRNVLFTSRMKEFLKEGYYFTVFNPTNIPAEHTKIVFLTKGFDRISTRYLTEDYFVVNLSRVSFQDYRTLLLSYVMTSKSFSTAKESISFAGEVLESLYMVKQKTGYSNPDPFYITTKEALFVKAYCDQKSTSSTSYNCHVQQVKRFFQWCQSSNYIRFEPLFFDYFHSYKGSNPGNAKAIPDDDLIKINEYLYEKKDISLKYKLLYAIFHIALQTEFRISQICSLKIGSIKQTIKTNQYVLTGTNKTSGGDTVDCVITETTYRVLKSIIDDTNYLREDCNAADIKEYIFIYQREIPKTCAVIGYEFVSEEISKACKALGINKYTAANLRDTYMTKSLDYIIRNGKSNLEMSLLTKHKHIDTTLNHYIDLELEKMLEATYQVEIGNNVIDTDARVVDDIPSVLSSIDSDVENGCGKCSAKNCCEGVAALSCLACKHFITTPKHKPYFEEAINKIDQQIISTSNRHEKEDLTTIKTLYAGYLLAIIAYQENKKNE